MVVLHIAEVVLPAEGFLNTRYSQGESMKIPKSITRYCKYCRKHTEQKVSQNKKRAPSSLSRGSKYRARLRGRARGVGNLGRYSKPAVTKFKRTGAKNTKKTDLRYACNVCKKMSSQPFGIRAKRVELV